MLQIIAQDLGLILGSLLAGILLWWLSFSLSKLCRHPKWGMPIVAPLLVVTFGHQIYRSEFLELTLMFSVLISGLLWIEGGEWERIDSKLKPEPANTSPINGQSETAHYRYPAIAACISECRSPSRAEIRKVAKRIRSEAYPGRRLDPILCRRILRTAFAALDGMANVENGRGAHLSPENTVNTIITERALRIDGRRSGSSKLNSE